MVSPVSSRLVALPASRPPSPAAKAQASAEHAAAAPAAPAPRLPLLTAEVQIELDKASGRFVQTLVESESKAVLRRYPDDAQLAFSRGVNAYVQAMRS
jgi:hypothetical protein